MLNLNKAMYKSNQQKTPRDQPGLFTLKPKGNFCIRASLIISGPECAHKPSPKGSMLFLGLTADSSSPAS